MTSRGRGSEALESLNRGRAEPEMITLGVKPGQNPCGKPPVRIYLGTQGAQYRAERVFIWSIEKLRDPRRVYQIYIMRELVGFDRRRWTTGFTNYRFAIPEYAHSRGRAIWNDVDQIYLADPAELFDTDMNGHGFLAMAPRGRIDTAVMLIDCERMAKVWTLNGARHDHKKTLIGRAKAVPGLRGDLSPAWHARDAKEYIPGHSKCLHYTTLHTQPWRPCPERFVYQEHPLGKLWYELEAEADKAGFHHFNRLQPTLRYRKIANSMAATTAVKPAAAASPDEFDQLIAQLRETTESRTLLEYQPYQAEPGEVYDAVVCRWGLESIPEDDLPWVLDEIFSSSRRFVCATVDCETDQSQSRPTSASLATEPSRWPRYFEAASERYPRVHWELTTRCSDGSRQGRYWGGTFARSGPPQVWVLSDDEPECAEPALALADALGWPYQRRRSIDDLPIVDSPDLVIASGAEAIDQARRLRRDANHRLRVVQLGVDAGSSAEELDLIVAPVSQGLFPTPGLFETATPLTHAQQLELADLEPWKASFAESPAPRSVAIIDGPSADSQLSRYTAACIGADLAAVSEQGRGSLFVLLNSDMPTAAEEALRSALALGTKVERVDRGRYSKAYWAHLALADEFIVLGDSEQTTADLCATGKPVAIYRIPRPPESPIDKLRGAVLALALAPRANDRGTVRPQQGLEYLCSRLIAKGYVRPPHDPGRMHDLLIKRGAARFYGEPAPRTGFAPLRELERVTARVRSLMGVS